MSAAPSYTSRLKPKKREALRLALTPRLNEYIPHYPTARQHAGLILNDRREVLYGGAAGGGKSDWLLISALQYCDVPGYAALLMRRTYAQLSKAGGLLERAQEWLSGTRAHGTDTVNGTPTKWIFPGHALLEFGHCQHEKNKLDYQSAEYQFVGFDELTQFTEAIYLYIGMSRLRRLEGSGIPIRVRSASNPGGTGHVWVKDRLVDSHVGSRVYLPAKLDDNPYLDRAEYESSLNELHPYDRQQLLDGDWNVRPPGAKFKREWFDVIPERPSLLYGLCRYWDTAATEHDGVNDPDWTAGAHMGRMESGKFPILNMAHFRGTPGTVKKRIVQTANLDGHETKIVVEQEGGSSGKYMINDLRAALAGFSFKGDKVTGNKFIRMDPLASAAEAGLIPLVNGAWVQPFLEEVEMIQDNDEHAHDDQGDSASGAYKETSRTRIGSRRVMVR